MSEARTPYSGTSVSSAISGIAATALRWSPTAWIRSWIQYIGTLTHVRPTIAPHLAPLHSIHEHLQAVHVYTSAACNGITRTVPSHHYCAHLSRTFRQCLIYDSNAPNARLIGVEYMIPRERFERLPETEKKYWHSHVHEVESGMLVLPYPEGHDKAKWDRLETQALEEVRGWYGKTWHFWEVDREGEEEGEFPWGEPMLMGSLTDGRQADVDGLMEGRDREMGVDTKGKREMRRREYKDWGEVGVSEGADSWWREAEKECKGVYAK